MRNVIQLKRTHKPERKYVSAAKRNAQRYSSMQWRLTAWIEGIRPDLPYTSQRTKRLIRQLSKGATELKKSIRADYEIVRESRRKRS